MDGYLFTITCIGLLVGSFLNVVILRLPEKMKSDWRREAQGYLELAVDPPTKFGVVFPASHCPHCKTPLKPWHNIPLVSYLFLRGKCFQCKTPISLQYPFVELVTALATGFCIYHFGATYEGYFAVVFTWALIALIGIDAKEQLLPDSITLPLLWVGLIANSQGLFTDLNAAVWGAVAGYLSLWSVYWLFKLVTGKEGMGYGDFKLLAALGAWMGWQMLPQIIILSSIVGAIVGVAGMVLAKRDKNIPMAFGPFLGVAGWIAFFWGAQINAAYLGG